MELILLSGTAFFRSISMPFLVSFWGYIFNDNIATPLRKLGRRFLPKPGEGPSEETMRKGFFDCFIQQKQRMVLNIFRMQEKEIQVTGLPQSLFVKVPLLNPLRK
ncbi:MAG: hypothetical protein CM1200mP12_04700 [Gammaproteobacteria bacterium]|nr:MAG: hypothetical protein CM1200mP12_04700 [Gammaproteobacteria bacterium]